MEARLAEIDAFFAGKREAWMMFERLRERISVRWPSVKLRVMKTCIAFDNLKPFVYVSFPPRKSMRGLFVTISLRERMEHPRFFMVVPVSKTRITVHIHTEDDSAIDDELLDLIALSLR